MVRALIFGLMVTNILEIGMKIKDMVRAHKLVHLETSTQENGEMVKEQDQVHIFGLMEVNILDNTHKTTDMVKVHTNV